MSAPKILPEELTPLMALPNWVLWRWETNKDGKPTKVPYQAKYPSRKANTASQWTWSDFATALAAADQADGVGFCFGKTDKIAFDIDHCRDPASGVLDPWAADLIERSNTYAEITPSGAGVHVIGTGSGKATHRRFGVGANGMAVELFRKAVRFITVTGNMLPGSATELSHLDGVMDAVLAELDTGPTSNEPTPRVFSDVAGIQPEIKITSLDDDRLQSLSAETRHMIVTAMPLPGKEHLRGGGGHARVVAELARLGLNNDQIKSIYKLGKIADGPTKSSRSFDGYVNRTISFCRPIVEREVELEAWGAELIKQLLASFARKLPRLIQSSAEFVGGFVPPDPLIEGLLQRQFVYALTGMTGHGKTCVALLIAAHAALGRPLDGKDVEKVRVLFFAGENPDDVRMRWIKLCEEMGQDPDNMDVFFLPGTPPISSEAIRKRIDAEAEKCGPFGLLIVDTSAAYFPGDDENSNAQLGAHARNLRSFVDLPGRPTVLVTCHPTKNPDMANLLPRGGGAFLNEMDGNLVAINNDSIVTVHWHGKFRGADFAPMSFRLQSGAMARLRDRKGRPIFTVTAASISEAEKGGVEDVVRKRQDELLVLLQRQPALSLAKMAEALGWKDGKGQPNKTLANRMLGDLIRDRLVVRKRGRIGLTTAGEKAAKEAAK